MIAATVEELTPVDRDVAGVPRARGVSGHDLSPAATAAGSPGAQAAASARAALTDPERERVMLAVLHAERLVDVAPEETFATTLPMVAVARAVSFLRAFLHHLRRRPGFCLGVWMPEALVVLRRERRVI